MTTSDGWRLMVNYRGTGPKETPFTPRRGAQATALEVAEEIMAMQPRAPEIMLEIARVRIRHGDIAGITIPWGLCVYTFEEVQHEDQAH